MGKNYDTKYISHAKTQGRREGLTIAGMRIAECGRNGENAKGKESILPEWFSISATLPMIFFSLFPVQFL
jgi:hypothetical protein